MSPEPLRAGDKLTLLLSLIPYLIDNPGVPVAEAAAHFGVDPQALRDAAMLIGVSGVPGETHAYQHGDLFDIDWDALEQRDEVSLTSLVALDDTPRLSAREAATLIAGLQYLSALPEHRGSEALTTLTAKLAAAAAGAPAPVAVSPVALDATVDVVRAAVDAGRQLAFSYRNARGEHERRQVDPLRVESIDTAWYLRAWDRTREALRTFRLDRMQDAAVLDAPIDHAAAAESLPERLFEADAAAIRVELSIAEGALPLLADYEPRVTGAIRPGYVAAEIRVAHFDGLRRLVAGMPDAVEVLSPPAARAAVAAWARAALREHASDRGMPAAPNR